MSVVKTVYRRCWGWSEEDKQSYVRHLFIQFSRRIINFLSLEETIIARIWLWSRKLYNQLTDWCTYVGYLVLDEVGQLLVCSESDFPFLKKTFKEFESLSEFRWCRWWMGVSSFTNYLQAKQYSYNFLLKYFFWISLFIPRIPNLQFSSSACCYFYYLTCYHHVLRIILVNHQLYILKL